MELVNTVLEFLKSDAVIYVGVGIAISDALALIPALKSNSVIQLVGSGLKKALGLLKKLK